MILSREVLVLLTWTFGIVRSAKTSVKYAGSAGQSGNRIGCAAANADPSFMAVRIHEETGACQGLTWDDWGSNPTYEDGYKYMEKKKTVEDFKPPLLCQKRFQWPLPGRFGNGGRIDIYLTHTNLASLDYYNIQLLDSNQDGTANFLVFMAVIKRSDSVRISSRNTTKTYTSHSYSTFPSTDDVKVSFVPGDPNILVYIDNELIGNYTYPSYAHPNDMKYLLFSIGGTYILQINNIVFNEPEESIVLFTDKKQFTSLKESLATTHVRGVTSEFVLIFSLDRLRYLFPHSPKLKVHYHLGNNEKVQG